MIFLFHRLVAVHLKRQYVTPFQPTSAGRAAAARCSPTPHHRTAHSLPRAADPARPLARNSVGKGRVGTALRNVGCAFQSRDASSLGTTRSTCSPTASSLSSRSARSAPVSTRQHPHRLWCHTTPRQTQPNPALPCFVLCPAVRAPRGAFFTLFTTWFRQLSAAAPHREPWM